MHTTNYTNAFIEVAEDCKAELAKIPPNGEERTIARLQYDMIIDKPYAFTSDDVLFSIYAARNVVPESELERERFFSKGQACLRASQLAKVYGWGIHYDAESRIALYAIESDEYRNLKNDSGIKHLTALKSSKR